jgi:FdhD protein
VESLAEALRATPVVGSGLTVRPAEVHEALDELGQSQALWTETRAVHAAALWTPGKGVAFVREDVGRHNALDKTIGAWARRGSAPADVVLLTSRVSVEMVQKAAVAGAQMVIAVSAPTALAVRVAESSGVTLVAVARSDSFEVFTHPDRIAP